jgi:Protein phosphatase 2C
MTACAAAPFVIAASQIGESHQASGAPCQDAYAWAEVSRGLLLIAVADGVGAAPRSDEGAAIVVEAAVNSALTACGEESTPDDLPGLLRRAATAARAALERHAEEHEVSLSDLASTLVVVAVSGGSVCAAQVGDGAVVAETVEGLTLVSGPDHGEYINDVVPLTAGSWLDALRVSPILAAVRAIAVFTDGCERAALRRDRSPSRDLIPHQGFFGPLFEFGRSATGEAAEGELRGLLASPKMAESSDDDKTLIVAILDPVVERPAGLRA